MFTRRRKQAGADSGGPTALVDFENAPHTAAEGFGPAHRMALCLGGDARLYLILGEDVDDRGQASSWQFHYLFADRHCEARYTTRTGAVATSGRPEICEHVIPFPEPGSIEATLNASGGPYMVEVIERAWEERLDRLGGLPLDFYDSSDSVAVMQEAGCGLFNGGPIRLKARSLPWGVAVWEAATASDLIQTTFGRDAASAARELIATAAGPSGSGRSHSVP
jgi:hypothetical protein